MTKTEYFAENLLGSVFYFCLKKTGSRYDAEELAADISLTVVEALSKSPEIESFEAWVRAIAHRRFARWVKARVAERENRVFAEDSDETADEPTIPEPISDEAVEDAVLRSEEYALLRRELAFIACEHRCLIVAHYIDEIPISELAKRFEIPEGTVKTRLMKARKLLKEGMNMAREFGKRSYNPEALSFMSSGGQPDGLPWRAVERKIPVNILCQASDNPSTAEELAMELGIALPYMEDELAVLERATLVKRLGTKPERYITSFYIADLETQNEIFALQREGSPARAELLFDAIGRVKDGLLANIGSTLTETNFMWLISILMYDKLLEAAGVNSDWGFKRPNNGTWGFMGMERGAHPGENVFINHSGTGSSTESLWCYDATNFGFRRQYLDYMQLQLLRDFIVNGRTVSSVSDGERATFDELCSYFAHVEGDRLVPDIAVYKYGRIKASRELILSTESGRELLSGIKSVFESVQAILKKCTNPILHETLGYYASTFMYDTRGMLLNDLVSSGRLEVPAHDSRAGIYIIV